MQQCRPYPELKITWKGGYEVSVQQNSIVNISADAIAISCSPTLTFSSGVARVVARAAGHQFKHSLDELKQQRGFRTHRQPGEATVLSAGDNLQATNIIALCSPNRIHLQEAYRNAFLAADQHCQCHSLCICPFGTGQLNLSEVYSASKAFSVIEELIKNSQLQHLKVIKFVDSSANIVEGFVKVFSKRASSLTGAVITFDGKPLENSDGEDTVSNDEKLEEISTAIDAYISVVNLPSSTTDVPSTSNMAIVDDICAICLSDFNGDQSDAVMLNKCSHIFHRACLQRAFTEVQAQCPTCKVWYGVPHGNQPLNASMHIGKKHGQIPGFPDANGHFEIVYDIPSGIQMHDHPRPGHRYHGTIRTAYLPNNEQGRKVLELFRLAFRNRLMFTIGDSVTTGMRDQVVWNCIHNKTKIYGGPQNFGYPDDTYLDRVTEELAGVGITQDLLQQQSH